MLDFLVIAMSSSPTLATTDESDSGDNLSLGAPWEGPHGGVPPFDKVGSHRSHRFGPALTAAVAAYRSDIEAIAGSQEPVSFENTLGALEDAGREYSRVYRLFEVYSSTMNDQQMQALEVEWAPRFAALHDEVIQNDRLFARLRTLKTSEVAASLDTEQARLLKLTYDEFVRCGADLSAPNKAKLREINEELAALYTRFSQNLLKDEEDGRVVIDNRAGLAGLSQALIDAAAEEAKGQGLVDCWVIRNTRSSAEPFLQYAEDRTLREKVWRMFVSRGDQGGDTDNNAVVSQILKLRFARATLLGFPTHAHWQLVETMAKTPERAMELMKKVWAPAVARVDEEVEAMLEVARERGEGLEAIEPWDYRFYAEKVRGKKFQLDASALEPYLQLEKMLEAQFWMASELYGLTFQEVGGLPIYHEDVRIFEVLDAQNEHRGYWYYDPYAREGKRSGAWMSEYRTQESFKDTVTPIVSNNSNYTKSRPGETVLITFDDAKTMFHEFGHALHGLLSQVRYPTLAGTNVARDFVEFPSQFHEHWLTTRKILKRFALHYKTGEPMPDELIARLKKAATFNTGFSTVEYLSSALVDMLLHLAGGVDIDPAQFEADTLADLGMPSSMVMRHRIPQFAHVFSDDGYSAGYYSYLWAEVLDQDAWRAFDEQDDPFDRALAQRLVHCVLSAGNRRDPVEAYREFRGADPEIGPLLAARGFPLP